MVKDFKSIANKVVELYREQEKNEILSTRLRELLGFENNGKTWATVVGYLVSQKWIEKSETTPERSNGKPVYYYKLCDNVKEQVSVKSYVVLDQFGKKHEYQSDESLDEELELILSKYANLKLTVYKPIKVAQNKTIILEID